MNKSGKTSLGTASGFALLTASVAFASVAHAQVAKTQAQKGDTIETVTVTAERRQQDTQKVDIALTALSGDVLASKNVLRELDLQNASPGLSITKAGLTESVNIRGIGLASGSPAVTNGVATYLDGVFQPPIVSGGEFYDMQDIEVLRGPQGTLVGANSTGGAVYLNTKKPELGEFSGDVSAWGGSYDNLGVTGAINIPLGDTLALRVAGLTNTRDSYYKDLGPAHDTPDMLKEHDGRVQLSWKPGHFQALAKIELVNRQTGGYAYQPITSPTLQYGAGATGIPWTVSYDSPTANNEIATIADLEMKYVFDNGLTLRFLSGYVNKRINNLYDSDGTDLPVSTATPQVTQKQFVREQEYSEEFNVISPDTGKLTYVVGAYAQSNYINVRIVQNTIKAPGGTPSSVYIEPDAKKLLLGVFGQITYRFTDQWSIDAGLRYSHFHFNGSGGVYVGRGAPIFPPLGLEVAPQTGTEGDGRPTGKIALNYKPDDNSLFYAFVARGYKNGGVNPPSGTIQPETVWDYEGGWKTSFLNDHIRTQIGVYYNDYKNFQEDVTNPKSGGSGVANLASATIYGLEASAQAHLGGVSLNGSLAYNHSQMSAFTLINREVTPAGISLPQCATGVPSGPTCFNYTYVTNNGGENLFSPTWTGNITAEYEIPVNDDVIALPRVGFSYVGSQWDYVIYNPATDLIKAHSLVNAGITVQYQNILIDFYATNLADAYYVAGRSGNNLFYGAPREFGVRLSASF